LKILDRSRANVPSPLPPQIDIWLLIFPFNQYQF